MDSLPSRIGELAATDDALRSHPHLVQLTVVLGSQTSVSSAGYPYISEAGFRLFVEQVPHLFASGLALLDWLGRFERRFADASGFTDDERLSVGRAVRVVRTMIFTAVVTAPPDLWVVRQVLDAHRRLGVTEALLDEAPSTAEALAARLGLDARQLGIDLHLLTGRGYLEEDRHGFAPVAAAPVRAVLTELPPLEAELRRDWVEALGGWIASGRAEPDDEALRRSLVRLLGAVPGDEAVSETGAGPRPGTGTWIASAAELEIGYRLLPVALALHVAGRSEGLLRGEPGEVVVGGPWPLLRGPLERAGLVAEDAVTELGARCLSRGPGPFGIIAAYQPYFDRLDDLLRGDEKGLRVRRAANVAASQDANRKTFEAANDALDRFCRETGFEYTVFLEHAVGQGEAVRQRWERDRGRAVRYFGADLEDAAIDQAVRQQRLGALPPDMEFIRNADIGEPERVIDYLAARGVDTEGAVMMVGNGFHEIRDQTDEKMRSVFAAYRKAGMLLIFTEETALTDDELVATAWNTYHAGFRYVHEMSGQGLRRAWGDGEAWGWSRLAAEGGYVVLEDYCFRTRTIFPSRKPDRRNPAISMSYFCVPRGLAVELGLILPGD